jgi:hypothetical protein
MDKVTQALELCIAARMTYNTCRLSLHEKHGRPILPDAIDAIEEPFKILEMSPAQSRVIKDRCLRIERGKLSKLLKNRRGLEVIYMLNHFLDTLQKKYINIPPGCSLWKATQGVFLAVKDQPLTDTEKMKASRDGAVLASQVLKYFQSKGLYR